MVTKKIQKTYVVYRKSAECKIRVEVWDKDQDVTDDFEYVNESVLVCDYDGMSYVM
jgi:hypothetical protein